VNDGLDLVYEPRGLELHLSGRLIDGEHDRRLYHKGKRSEGYRHRHHDPKGIFSHYLVR